VNEVNWPAASRFARRQGSCQYMKVLTDSELATEADRGRKNGYPTEDPESLRRWDVVISLVARFSHGRLYGFTVDMVETD
jgi:hypothetical protein